jgi:beta-xylosidase
VATREADAIQVLLWNDQPPEVRGENIWQDVLQLPLPSGLPQDETWLATTSHLRAGAGSAFETWETMGRPLNLSNAQLTLLRSAAEPAMKCEVLPTTGNPLSLTFTLAPNEVLHIELRPLGPVATPKSGDLEAGAAAMLEGQLGEKSRL